MAGKGEDRDIRQRKHSKRKQESKHEVTRKIRRKADVAKIFLPFEMKTLLIAILALICGGLNSYHQYTMFENDRHFSHLSNLEREMTFRTEMGLYYSYFKTLIEAPTLWEGLHSIMNDKLTEYPDTINTLKRFNLYPEIVLAGAFKIFQSVTDYYKIHTVECWQVNRGQDMSPVESCEGLGDPAYFYISAVFLWNGLVSAALFLYGYVLSESVVGGLMSVSCFFFNHGECTRVQWTPPLRESFAYPLFLCEMLAVTLTLRYHEKQWKNVLAIAIFSGCFILAWQFAQFALLTQTLAILGVYMIGQISKSTFQRVLLGQMAGLILGYSLLFGNQMLLASFYPTALIMSFIICLLEPQFNRLKWSVVKWVTQLGVLGVGCVGLKALSSALLQVKDDAHIWNILRSKFSNYRDFHTMLYTCAVEFDFMERETPLRLMKTLVLPVVFLVIVVVMVQVVRDSWNMDHLNKEEPPGYIAQVVYNVLQLCAFTVMAVLIMRLKLFFTPQLCLLVSLLSSRKFFGFIRSIKLHYTGTAILLCLMSIQGIQNIQHQRSILGEYSNPSLEELIEWVNRTTSQDAVFAGPMPTMANLMLSSRRPIINHPHYEDAGLRERTRKVYTIYSRKSPDETYHQLKELGAQFVVLDTKWCFGKSRDGCGMGDVWDVEDPGNRNQEMVCQRLLRNPLPFKQVFRNNEYAVLKL